MHIVIAECLSEADQHALSSKSGQMHLLVFSDWVLLAFILPVNLNIRQQLVQTCTSCQIGCPRCALSTTSVQTKHKVNLLTEPDWLSRCLPKWCLLCLQLFCGMLARIEQFADVMRDSKLQIKKVNASCALTSVLLNHGTAAVCVYTSRASQEVCAWTTCITGQYVRPGCYLQCCTMC